MSTSQRGNEGDSFAALDFGDEAGFDSGAALDFGDEAGFDGGGALDFGDEAGDHSAGQSVVEALEADEPAWSGDTGTAPSVIDALPQDSGDTEDADAAEDEFSWELTTVTNPAETVTVSTIMDGSICSVELAADAGSMTESELADEILVIADVARQKASSVLHSLLVEGMQAQGIEEGGLLTQILGPGFLNLSSPKQAAEAQAEVFATRYGSDNH